MALATLSIDLVAKLGELQSGFDKAYRLAEQNSNKMQASFSKASAAALAIGGALAGALAGGEIVRRIKERIDGLSELKSAFDATGSSIENLSGLEDVAARTGTTFETVTSALIKLNQALNTAKPDTDQAKAIEAIGLSVEKLKKEDPSEAFRQIAVGLSKFADDGNKARIAQLLFGKSLKEVAPLLQNLVGVGELVATVTTDQALAAERFSNALATLEKNATDSGRAIAIHLLPVLNRTLEAFNKGGFKGAFAELFGGSEVKGAIANVQAIEQSVKDLRLELAKPTPKSPLRDALRARLDTQLVELQKAKATLAAFDTSNYSNEGRNKPRPSIADVTTKPSKDDGAAKKAESYLESLRKQLEGTQDLTAAERVLNEIREGALQGGTAKQRERAKALGIEIDLTKEATRVARERADLRNKDEQSANDAARANEQAGREEIKALLADTFAVKYARAQQDIEKLNRTFLDAAGNFRAGFDPAQYAQAIGQVTAKIADTTTAQLDAVTVFAEQASRNIQDALGNTLEEVLSGNFKNIGKLWQTLLAKMLAQAAAAKLNEALFSKGGSGDNLLKILGTAIFGAFGGGYGGGRAVGGPVNAGVAYLVGERGPELVVPRDNARVLTAANTRGAMARGGAGSVVINSAPNISIDARSDQAQVAQLVSAGMVRAQESMWRQLHARGYT